MTDEQIKHMVDRFLGWKLPENFNPDGGVSFKKTFNDHLPTPSKYEPSGTNLLDATQAMEMVRYMIEGMPDRNRPGTILQGFDGDEQRKDCFLCSAAMAAGISYDDAWNALNDELRACLRSDGRGPIGDQCDQILQRLGFERVRVGARTGDPTTAPGDFVVLFMLPEYATSGFLRNVLWGRRALLQVPSKNYAGEQHIIYWDGHRLRDPSNKRQWQWQEVEPIYIWLFDERRG